MSLQEQGGRTRQIQASTGATYTISPSLNDNSSVHFGQPQAYLTFARQLQCNHFQESEQDSSYPPPPYHKVPPVNKDRNDGIELVSMDNDRHSLVDLEAQNSVHGHGPSSECGCFTFNYSCSCGTATCSNGCFVLFCVVVLATIGGGIMSSYLFLHQH